MTPEPQTTGDSGDLADDHPLVGFARGSHSAALRFQQGLTKIAGGDVSDDLRDLLADVAAGRVSPRTLLANDEFGKLAGAAFENAKSHQSKLSGEELQKAREAAAAEVQATFGPEIAEARRRAKDLGVPGDGPA